jgi:hypothetical protein
VYVDPRFVDGKGIDPGVIAVTDNFPPYKIAVGIVLRQQAAAI